MRPLRFLLLLALFIVLPVILTCISLFSSEKVNTGTLNVGYQTRAGRFRALFSFSTPSSLFPPSAIISLRDDNSTSFVARPAAFGPSLPSTGLSGQLWVGKGFGEAFSLSDDDLKVSGFELGCSDVPGWDDDHKKRVENGAIDGKESTKIKAEDTTKKTDTQSRSVHSKRYVVSLDEDEGIPPRNDGTDDHLHHPLPDSKPATQEKPGEPASINTQDKTKASTHADIESLQESADIAGKIVMLSRGGCGFLEKVKWAQRRGGIAVIVGDNEPGAPLTVMYAKGDTSNVTIPSIFTSYYSAHLLSSLVPPEESVEVGTDGKPVSTKDAQAKKDKEDDSRAKQSKKTKASTKKPDDASEYKSDKGWVQNVLSVVGMDDESDLHGEDSRRPPGSGNIDWVKLEDWDDDKPLTTSSTSHLLRTVKPATATSKVAKSQTTTIKKTGDDDFIIGVQDWRDTEVIAPKSTATQPTKKQKGKVETSVTLSSTSSSGANPTATALKGGSITPGSGEYNYDKDSKNTRTKQGKGRKTDSSKDRVPCPGHRSFGAKIASFFRHEHKEIVHPRPDERSSSREYISANGQRDWKERQEHGLWVTLTPTSPSTSPFFDTLLVLVVSPLVTLTFVYGLLLLRSRIRRRRWRAPKSVVDRLPVRTYQTMPSTSSSASSSSILSPQASPINSPTITPSTRVRPRSQTTTGVISTSPPVEKVLPKSSPKNKKYTGRQVECVVCLEEYVDGESQVMSLPCGHEFHAECITPWLVSRRRTCPICKGDVVRSFSRANGDASRASEYAHQGDEQTSDDIQDQAIMTTNSDGSAAIPIPVQEENINNSDIERGSDVETPLLGSTPRVQQGRWRGIFSNSIGRLSGDTLWRSGESSVNDRNR